MPSKSLIECHKHCASNLANDDAQIVASAAVEIMESSEHFNPSGFKELCDRLPQYKKSFILKVMKEMRTHQKTNADIFCIAENL